MLEKASGTLMSLAAHTNLGEIVIHCISLCGGLSEVDGDFERQLRSSVPGLGRDMRHGNSMLAIRSPSWPEVCPRFCLFVLPEVIHDSIDHLHQLFEEAVYLRNSTAKAIANSIPWVGNYFTSGVGLLKVETRRSLSLQREVEYAIVAVDQG